MYPVSMPVRGYQGLTGFTMSAGIPHCYAVFCCFIGLLYKCIINIMRSNAGYARRPREKAGNFHKRRTGGYYRVLWGSRGTPPTTHANKTNMHA